MSNDNLDTLIHNYSFENQQEVRDPDAPRSLYYSLDRAIYFVDQQTPSSSDETKVLLAKKLLKIMDREDECIERAWEIKSYWD